MERKPVGKQPLEPQPESGGYNIAACDASSLCLSFQDRVLADFSPRQSVAAIVAGVVGMAADFNPFNRVRAAQFQKFLP